MVWLYVGFGGRLSLVFIKGTQNRKDYIQEFKIDFLSFGSDLGGENWTYQQDRDSIHTAQKVKKNDSMTMMFKCCLGQPIVQISRLPRIFGLCQLNVFTD